MSHDAAEAGAAVRARLFAWAAGAAAVAAYIAWSFGAGRVRPLPVEPPAACVVVLHINDLHGQIEPTAPSPGEREGPGGLARMAALAARERRTAARAGCASVFVSAGDNWPGTVYSSVGEGAIETELLGRLQLDATAVGNHEFDFGRERLDALIAGAPFPFLSANVRRKDTGEAVFGRSIVLERRGRRIAIAGVTTPDTPIVTSPRNVEGLVFTDPTAEAAETLRALSAPVDLRIVLSHLGYKADLEFVAQGVDAHLVVGGHSHTTLTEPDVSAGVPIVQAGDRGRYLGRAVFRFDGPVPRLAEYHLLPVAETIGPDPEVFAAVAAERSKLETALSEPVARTELVLPADWRITGGGESAIGNLTADALRIAAGAAAALVNTGGIRGALGPGVVTRRKLMEAYPWENHIVVLSLRGAVLREALVRSERLVAGLEKRGGKGGVLQVAGVAFSARGDGTVGDVRVGGAPLDDSRLYDVATIEFLDAGGDGYAMLQRHEGRRVLEVTQRDAVARCLIERCVSADDVAPGRRRALQP